jgi:uncharacterized protein
MTELLGGLAFGLLGSAHCVAMCGPLVALAGRVPADGSQTPLSRVRVMLRYHLGRLGVYLLLGSLVGGVGVSLAQAGFGRALAFAAGGLLLAQALTASSWIAGRPVTRWSSGLVVRVVGMASGWLRRRGQQGPLVLGALTGLLPCGLLYAALTAATGFGSLRGAMAFMMAFGVGTLPLLAIVALASDRLTAHAPVRLRRAGPVALAVVGVLLIVRGAGVSHAGHGDGAADSAPHVHAR